MGRGGRRYRVASLSVSKPGLKEIRPHFLDNKNGGKT